MYLLTPEAWSFFFFQAEDGIRDYKVTGVQTCALPISGASGQLGPFVIRALQEQHDLVLLSRRPPDAAFAALPWVQGDLTVFADCQRAVQGVDAIQHLAAQPWPVDHPALRGKAAAHGLAFDTTFQSNLV